MLAHVTLQLLKNILCMWHDHLINKLSDFLLKGIFDLISAPLIHDGLDRRPGDVVHVLNTHCLVGLKKFKGELQNGLVLGHIAFEWNLGEDGIDHGSVVVRFLGQRHVLELNDSAGGSNDVVLGISLAGVLMELAKHSKTALKVWLEQDWCVLCQDSDVISDVPVDFAIFGITVLLEKGEVIVEVLWDNALAVSEYFRHAS